eukprot:TRINITY_DN20206_c0_g1_i2.p1 TRINITY_DN20206_c0_g1~~TRINITY_DN20206_c0_g1_i2.p1  ORF type:complete len:370 (+),score=77.65 TRINITY_DN20206_c0_g1_i2:52-1161(+)
MRRTVPLGKIAARQKSVNLVNTPDVESQGTKGKDSANVSDIIPGMAKKSHIGSATAFLGRMQQKQGRMLEQQGWGASRTHEDGQFRDVGFDSYKTEDFGKQQGTAFNISKDVHDVAGQKGLRLWKEENSSEIRATTHSRRYVATQERTDLPPQMQWMVPPKHLRLENVLKERERRLQKVPEYDLSPHLARSVQKMWDGLEVALIQAPLPFERSRENFCITHIHCAQERSEELWLVCWKLVLDESQRSKYQKMLEGGVVGKWAGLIKRYTNPSEKNFKPIMRFVYDDGTIPFKASVIEQNIRRAEKGLPPIEKGAGLNEPVWESAPASVIHDIYAVRNPSDRDKQKSPEKDRVAQYLQEARSTISSMKLI